jgi:hypothetical protein
MEATLNDARDLSREKPGVSPQLRLPGEEDGHATGPLRGPTAQGRARPSARPKGKSSRGVLMSTVGIVFLFGAAGYMGYAQRAQLERIPAVQKLVTKVDTWIGNKPVLTAANVAPELHQSHPLISVAPPAADATLPSPAAEKTLKAPPSVISPAVPKVTSGASVPVNSQAPKATGPAPAAPNSLRAQLQQFDAFQTPGRSGSTLPWPTPKEPAKSGSASVAATFPNASPTNLTIHSAQPAASTSKNVALASPVATHVAAPVQHASPATPSLTAEAVSLTATPMTDQQQLDVLHLVTELGVLVRDQRTKIVSLHDQVVGLSNRMSAQLTDFDRRLSVAEAKGAIDAAMGAADATAAASISQAGSVGQPAKAVHPTVRSVVPLAPTPIVRSVSDYDIQAASPGLAMLSTNGGDGGSIQVGVGDIVPGVGRVTSIYQSGTAWVVKTDHGTIQ